MGSNAPNPYQASLVPEAPEVRSRLVRCWPAIVALLACGYYLLSALSLPLVPRLWLGEVPVLALFQLPKAFLKSIIHTRLLWGMKALGLSHGSRSPDFIATHDLALGLAMALPLLLLVLMLALPKRVAYRRRWLAAVVTGAAIDAGVTFWFDTALHLKLFNAVYF